MTGILWYGFIFVSQVGQLESGKITDLLFGILEIHTLKKLPKTAPKIKMRR